jgi:hypothetical protein
MPVLGFGVFVMLRRQLVGIRDRVERAEAGRVPIEPAPDPTTPVEPAPKNGKKDGHAPGTVIAAVG